MGLSENTYARKAIFSLERQEYVYINKVAMLEHAVEMTQNDFTFDFQYLGKYNEYGYGDYSYIGIYTKKHAVK
jgi:hypothetical protein